MESPIRPERKGGDGAFPIIAIGASAGGLGALERFLSKMPEVFGFPVIFMQHLSPHHESLLPELLRSHMPDIHIEEVSDGMEILPGRLYVCPPAHEIGIKRGIFQVVARPELHVRFPIDEFFIALAEDVSERAIAVIFSGAGTDGARGVRTVRGAGGTVFVQDPATAEFPAMPLAAINTGQMDGVLPPEDIAGEIVKLHGSGALTSLSPDGIASPGQFEPFYRLLYEKTGYSFDYYKKSVLSRRIRRRMYLLGVSSANKYLDVMKKSEAEAATLASDLMIGVTSFFRDRLAWKALHLDVTRKLVAKDDDSPIRVWTPACATGEEAYTIAMILEQELDLAKRKKEIQVFATDVNDRALERAREGTYPASISVDVPPDYVGKFFSYSEDGGSLTISKDLRQRVVFAKQDILADPPFSRLDLVICRNLLIYLEPDAQEKCIAILHYALKKGGYLFLGSAESPGRGTLLFTQLPHKHCRVYQKMELESPARMPLAVPFPAEPAGPVPKMRVRTSERERSILSTIQESLLEEYAPAAIAIDQSHDILYHNGPTNRYLHHPRGTPTHNLLDLLPEHLRNRMRGALYRAEHEAKSVSIRASIPVDKGGKSQVIIRITKLRDNLFLIVFREKDGMPEQAEVPVLEAERIEETALRQLEIELSATRDDLQSHIEQLRSLNEELQSSNEELQAANEELETSREELQSLNEELITVNAQLQGKVEEQEETNNDLNNFLTSTSIPTIFLDHRLRVKRFTPAMSRLVTLIPGDMGRPSSTCLRKTSGSISLSMPRPYLKTSRR